MAKIKLGFSYESDPSKLSKWEVIGKFTSLILIILFLISVVIALKNGSFLMLKYNHKTGETEAEIKKIQ